MPRNSSKARQFASSAGDACLELGVEGVYVLEWRESDRGSSAGMYMGESMEALIKRVLDRQSDGSMSPADGQAIHLLKSLRNAALHQFRFDPPVIRSAARFPSNEAYEEALWDNKVLLERFREAVQRTGIKRSVKANPLHTTIGVPAMVNPPKGRNNSLCRIVTVTSYEDGALCDRFVLQLDKGVYERYFDKVKAALGVFEGRASISAVDGNGSQYFHPNGKDDEPVYRIMFEEPAEEQDKDVNGMHALLEVLKEVFPA
ncbi:hypothetical protein ES705_05506 [subsurface metagenome]